MPDATEPIPGKEPEKNLIPKSESRSTRVAKPEFPGSSSESATNKIANIKSSLPPENWLDGDKLVSELQNLAQQFKPVVSKAADDQEAISPVAPTSRALQTLYWLRQNADSIDPDSRKNALELSKEVANLGAQSIFVTLGEAAKATPINETAEFSELEVEGEKVKIETWGRQSELSTPAPFPVPGGIDVDVILFADFMNEKTRQSAADYLPKLQAGYIRSTARKALDEIIHAKRRLGEKSALLKKVVIWEKQSAELIGEERDLMSYEQFPEAAREVIKAMRLRAQLVSKGEKEYSQTGDYNEAFGRSIPLREVLSDVSPEEDEAYANDLEVMIGDKTPDKVPPVVISPKS